jgi:hypothetical protein
MTLRLNGSTSGYAEIDAPAEAGNNSIALPTGNGSAYQILRNGATAGSLEFTDKIVSNTAKAWNWNGLTTNAVLDFTGIPSWVKRVTVMFNGVSGSGTSPFVIQLGTSSGIDSTSTYGGSASFGGGGATDFNSTGFRVVASGALSAGASHSGVASIVLLGSNIWCQSGTLSAHSVNGASYSGGSKTLSGTLDRVRITTVNGTDTFDAGSINILVE